MRTWKLFLLPYFIDGDMSRFFSCDKCTYCMLRWIKPSAKCPKCKCKCKLKVLVSCLNWAHSIIQGVHNLFANGFGFSGLHHHTRGLKYLGEKTLYTSPDHQKTQDWKCYFTEYIVKDNNSTAKLIWMSVEPQERERVSNHDRLEIDHMRRTVHIFPSSCKEIN